MSSHESATAVLDWRQLRVEVVNRLAAASAKGKAHWRRLLDLVDQRLAAAPSAQAPPVAGRQWWLTEVRIEGFRGIPDSFELTLDPGAGLTVVHAPNGTGKSTVAERCAPRYGEHRRRNRTPWLCSRPTTRSTLSRSPIRTGRPRFRRSLPSSLTPRLRTAWAHPRPS